MHDMGCIDTGAFSCKIGMSNIERAEVPKILNTMLEPLKGC